MITPTIADRNMKIAVVETLKRNDVRYFSYRDGINPKESVIIILAVFTPFCAALSGGALGYLLADYFDRSELSTAVALFIGGGMGCVFGLAVLRWLAVWMAASYDADFDKQDELEPSPADAFIQRERRKEYVRVRGDMRKHLITFARHYNEVGTTAIGAWINSGHLRRADIEAVRDYLVDSLQVADRDSAGMVTLRPWTVDQLPRWAAGDFAGLVEIVSTSPTPGGAE